MTKRLLLLLAMVLAVALQTNPQSTQPGAPAPLSPPAGKIQGTVVKDGTTEPIPGVLIRVNGTGPGGAAASAVALAEQSLLSNLAAQGGAVTELLNQFSGNFPSGGAAANTFTTTTDSGGHFLIGDVPPGMRTVTAQLDGYFGAPRNGNTPSIVTANVTVVSRETADVKLAMIPGGTISGRITGPTGQPVTDAQVQVLKLVFQNGLPTMQQGIAAKTSDDRGEYRLFNVAPGDYYIAVVPRQTNIRGAPGGAASASIPMRTYYPDVSDASRAVSVTLKPGVEVSGMDITLREEMGATVSGQVSSVLPASAQVSVAAAAGQAGQTRTISGTNATLTLYPHDKNSIADITGNSVNVSLVAPNSGRFQILNVPPGTYDLFAAVPDASGFGPAAPPGQAIAPVGYGRTSVEVRGSAVDGLSLTAHPGVDIKGRVTVDGSVSTSVNARISLQPDDSASRIPVYQQVGRFVPMIDGNGLFTIPVVPEGRYRFQVTFSAAPAQSPQGRGRGNNNTPDAPSLPIARGAAAPINNAYVADIQQGGASVYDNGLDIGATSPGDVEVLIRTDGGSIAGTLTGPDHMPVASTMVVLVPSANRRQNLALYKTAVSNAMGNFTMTGIAPGQYKLFAWEDAITGAYQNEDYVRKYDELGTTVIVMPNTRAPTNVKLIPAEKK